MRRVYWAIPLVSLALTASCGVMDDYNDEHGTGDAGVASTDDSKKEVINMPDGFSNVAHACDGHGHRVFVETHTNQSKQLFVIDDPSCGE